MLRRWVVSSLWQHFSQDCGRLNEFHVSTVDRIEQGSKDSHLGLTLDHPDQATCIE